MNKNYYKILGISNTATSSEIKKAYFAKAKMYHPDVCKDKDAEKKFKDVSVAYETLKDENLRRDYDDNIKHGSSSNHDAENKYTDNHSETNYEPLQQMYKFASQDTSSFVNFIKTNYDTEKGVIEAYSYFWLSFWSGGKGTIDMLTNKTASKIFKAFCINPFIKEMKESLTKEVRMNDDEIDEVNRLKESVQNIYNSIPDKQINSQSTYNWMIRTIEEDNIFDDEQAMYYFLLISHDILKLLDKFELIYVAGSLIKAKSHYSGNTRVKRGGGILTTIMTVIGIIILFNVFF